MAARPHASKSQGPPAWAVLALLALFLVLQHGSALTVAFINDDYIFLDKTRAASFLSLWKPEALAFHWYRPWSRELHYWALQRVFGPTELPFHIASFALILGVLTLYFRLARRLAGGRAAAVSVAGLASLAAWGVPLVWIAGVQDLWLLLFTLLFLECVTTGRHRLALLPLALALVSKESASTLPAVAFAYAVTIERIPPAAAARRLIPAALVVVAWAAFHPVLGGRLWHPIADPLEPGLHPPLFSVAARTLGVPFNLDGAPAPESGLLRALGAGLVGTVLLTAVALLGLKGGAPPDAPRARGVEAFGAWWAAIGWLPLLMPTLGWHSYYALLGACGAWLVLGALLARWLPLAAVLVAALSLLRAARADTVSRDWGSEWYQRRAASFIAYMRSDLLHKHPALPPHSRLFFVRVPSNVGFLAGDGPAVRIWYRDSTLRAGYYPSYRPRAAGQAAGEDLFFRFDSTAGWIEVQTGAEDVTAARRLNPRWVVDHEFLAQTLANAGSWPAAIAEYEKLAAAESLRVDFAYNAGVGWEALGDSARAAAWYARAASLPGADAEALETARRFGVHLKGRARR